MDHFYEYYQIDMDYFITVIKLLSLESENTRIIYN